MRTERILCLLLACIATARSTDTNTGTRSKRDLQFLKDLISAKLFGEQNCTRPVIIKEDEEVKYFRIPGFKNILVKAVPKTSVVVDALDPLPPMVEELNPTLSMLEHYLGTNTPDETLGALQGLKKLLESGILSTQHEAVGFLPAVKKTYEYHPKIFHSKFLYPSAPKVPLVPVLPPSVRHPVPIFNEMIPISVNARPLKVPQVMPVPVLSKYSYKTLHTDGTMTSHNARRHGEVIVSKSIMPPPPLPSYITDRFQHIVFEPIDAPMRRLPPFMRMPIAPLPMIPPRAMLPLPPVSTLPMTPVPIASRPIPPPLPMAPLPIPEAPPAILPPLPPHPLVLPPLASPPLVVPPVAPLQITPLPVAPLPVPPALPPIRRQPTIVLPKRIVYDDPPLFNPLAMPPAPVVIDTAKTNRFSYKQANIDGSITNYYGPDVVKSSPELYKSMFVPGPMPPMPYADTDSTSKVKTSPSGGYSFNLRYNQRNEQYGNEPPGEPHLYQNPLKIPDSEPGRNMFRHINRAMPYDLTVSNVDGKLRFNHNSDVHVTTSNVHTRPEDELIPTKLMPHVGMYPYRQITHNGKLFSSRFVGRDPVRPAFPVKDTSFMPVPPMQIMDRTETVGAIPHSTKPVNSTPSGYSFKVVNNGSTVASYLRVPYLPTVTQTVTTPAIKTEIPTTPVVSTLPTSPGIFTADLLNPAVNNNGQKDTMWYSSPVPSAYTYQQVSHNNPQPFTLVPVGQKTTQIFIEHEHIGPDGIKYLCREDHGKNLKVVEGLPKNYVYIPPITTNDPLPTTVPTAQFSYKQTTSNETTKVTDPVPVTRKASKVVTIVRKVNKVSTAVQTTEPPAEVTVSDLDSFKNKPIVVPDVTSAGTGFSYTQSHSDGTTTTVQGNNNGLSVKVNEVEKPTASDRFRSDIPDAFS